MPYLSTKIRIEKTEFDRRIKLKESDKAKIRELYRQPEYSQRRLADMFGVSRRLIQFVLDPYKLKQNLEARIKRGGTKHYYNKEKHAVYMRNHRRYKQKLSVEGKI